MKVRVSKWSVVVQLTARWLSHRCHTAEGEGGVGEEGRATDLLILLVLLYKTSFRLSLCFPKSINTIR